MTEGNVISISPLDGAQSIEYKWANDTERTQWRVGKPTFLAYSDCPDCGGTGYVWRKTYVWQEQYRVNCAVCRNRHYFNPIRVAVWAKRLRRQPRMQKVRSICEAIFEQQVRKALHIPKRKRIRDWGPVWEEHRETLEPIRDTILARYNAAIEKFLPKIPE